MSEKNGRFKIDVVITWVDGDDPEWQKEKSKYQKPDDSDTRNRRFRDMGLLKYWFRGIEKNAPWVNKIFFVTCGHLPSWLNVENPKLQIVRHSEFIPQEYLPTFSSRPIELNLHRIKGLSEHFVYFNDDMYMIGPTKEKDFFRHGLPVSKMVLKAFTFSLPAKKSQQDPLTSIYLTLPICMAAINRNFNKNKAIRSNWTKWFSPRNGKAVFRTLMLLHERKFTGFVDDHLPYSYLKSTFEEVWENEGVVLRRACSHRFREPVDVSSRLMTFWQIAKGSAEPDRHKQWKKYIVRNDEIDEMLDAVRQKKYSIVCLNDGYVGKNYEEIQQKMAAAFEAILPEKSSYEIS